MQNTTTTSREKRQRILDAATAEFSTHGIAGARVDRIAEASGLNKRLIYALFHDKRSLFETVAADCARKVLDLPFDAADLPNYAADLFSLYQANPEVMRLANWHALEPGEVAHPLPRFAEVSRDMVRAIKRAQADGLVDSSFDARELLYLVAAITLTWSFPHSDGQGGGKPSERTLATRRAAVREAVRRLVEPRH
jgi:AcrR family transcriptional regulator